MQDFRENLPIPTGHVLEPDFDLLHLEPRGLVEEDSPEDNVLADHAGHDGDCGDDEGCQAEECFATNWKILKNNFLFALNVSAKIW